MDRWEAMRQAMVERQIAARGVRDPRVLEALRTLPREEFVPMPLRERAYDDTPLAIGEGQTISQPYIVAYMTEALELGTGDRVLEIGTGSGYAAAVLAAIASEVVTVEVRPAIAERARSVLERLGCDNVRVVVGDGSLGWPEAAPYDAIVVTAGGPDIPAALREQLAVGGRLVIPVGGLRESQRLVRVRRPSPEQFLREDLIAVRFVPLVGEQGWSAAG